MRAGDLMGQLPTVTSSAPVLDAARLLAVHNLPGVIVIDAEQRPAAILPGTRVLRMAVPGYCQDDPALARVIDERAADLFLGEMAGRTVACSLAERGADRELAVVDLEATLLEIAALMARTRTPLVAVADEKQNLLGGITLHTLLDRLLPR
jgi:CBS domain-containing protein